MLCNIVFLGQKKKLTYENNEKISSKDFPFLQVGVFFPTVPGPLLKKAFYTL